MGGGIPTGAIKSLEAPVEIDERSMTIEDELEPYHEGEIAVLHLYRTLYRDGYFNTICLPFDLATLTGTPLEGGELYTFESAEKESEGLLEVVMNEATEIEAGIPYLIRWSPSTPEIIPMPLVFHDVHIKDIEGQTIGASNEVQFVGNVPRKTLINGNHNQLFVGANDILYWPNTNDPMKGFRAYFQVPTSGPAMVPKGTRARIVLHHNTATSNENVQRDNIQCTKIIENGQLIIIKNGLRYTAQGQLIK